MDDLPPDLVARFELLTTVEREVLRLRAFDGAPKTLAQVAELRELDREGVRQIEVRALRKLA